MRHLTGIADLTVATAAEILDRARTARAEVLRLDRQLVAGLVFLTPSTRTKFGFAAAAGRLGGQALVVSEVRETGPGLPPESVADTVRVISGMSDVVVCRLPDEVDLSTMLSGVRCPLVNGGDGREHPTQALLDRFAIETLVGPLPELHIGISGDLRTRTVRSMLRLLELTPPRRLTLLAPPGRGIALDEVPPGLVDRTTIRAEPGFADIDALLLPGLAPGVGDRRLAPDAHLRFGFSSRSAPTLPATAVVLSPGPVIDEIEPSCAHDPRVRVAEQADLGVALRVGVLLHALDQVGGP
jgi:aspartate carbamoyltransferase catalytic subunit